MSICGLPAASDPSDEVEYVGCGCCSRPAPISSPAYAIGAAPRRVKISRVLFLFNPNAGQGGMAARRSETDAAVSELAKHGIHSEVVMTKHARHALEVIAERRFRDPKGPDADDEEDSPAFDCIVAVGGDGTFREVVEGVITEGYSKVPVIALPLGTGNNVMRDLGVLTARSALELIIGGWVQGIDAVHIEHSGQVRVGTEGTGASESYCINTACMLVMQDGGARAEGCRMCGPLRYDIGGAMAIFAYREHRIKLTLTDTLPEDAVVERGSRTSRTSRRSHHDHERKKKDEGGEEAGRGKDEGKGEGDETGGVGAGAIMMKHTEEEEEGGSGGGGGGGGEDESSLLGTADPSVALTPTASTASAHRAMDEHRRNVERTGCEDGLFGGLVVQLTRCNGREFRFAPYAQLSDGKFDFLAFQGIDRFGLIDLFDAVKNGGGHVFMEGVKYVRATRAIIEPVELHSEDEEPAIPLLCNIDGDEDVALPATFTIMKHCYTSFVPAPADTALPRSSAIPATIAE